MSEWQRIESAPRDGTRVLVSDGADVYEAWFHPGEGAWLDCDGIFPTHWMPKPEPPSMTPLTIRLPDDVLAALDRFIADQPASMSRPEAAADLVAEALRVSGYLDVAAEEE